MRMVTLRIGTLLASALVSMALSAGSLPTLGQPSGPAGSWGLLPAKHRVGVIRGSRTNNHGSHYLFGQSAIPLEQGDGYYKNTLLSVNAVNYGLTRHLSVGGGVELLSIITGRESGPVYFLNAKLAANISEVFHVGLSGFYVSYPFPGNLEDPQFTEKRPGFAVLMGSVTVGDPDFQLTLSAGGSKDWDANKQRPVVNIGGMARFFPRVALITENWLFFDSPDNYSLYCLGVRFIGETVAVDLALANNKQIREEVLPIGLPIISVSVAF